MKIKLLQINHVYHWRLLHNKDEHYNHLQLKVDSSYLQKLSKMPSWQALVERSKVLLKEGVERKCSLWKCRIAQLKLENVSWEQIFVIDLNHYMIIKMHHVEWPMGGKAKSRCQWDMLKVK